MQTSTVTSPVEVLGRESELIQDYEGQKSTFQVIHEGLGNTAIRRVYTSGEVTDLLLDVQIAYARELAWLKDQAPAQ